MLVKASGLNICKKSIKSHKFIKQKYVMTSQSSKPCDEYICG